MTVHADFHVLPADKQLIHVESTECICQPARCGCAADVWIHRPLDTSPHPVLTPPAGTEW